jgi:hypothetical protein
MSIKWNWGVGAALAYAVFVASTLGFVAFAMSRPVALVRSDYYEDALREDQKREAEANGRAFSDRLTLTVDGRRDLVVAFPAELAMAVHGTMTLYRASDPAADREVALAPSSDGTQTISLVGMPQGHWLVQLRWRVAQRDFYTEQEVVLR